MDSDTDQHRMRKLNNNSVVVHNASRHASPTPNHGAGSVTPTPRPTQHVGDGIEESEPLAISQV